MPTKTINNGLFIFRRDLRIVDNTTLNSLAKICRNIYTVFIFTPEQVGNRNQYKSNNSVQFMIESLSDLAHHISNSGGKLHTLFGKNNSIISSIIDKHDIGVVAFNIDITPYAINRDHEIMELCKKKNIEILAEHDYYLTPPGLVLSGSNKPYQKFTPYYQAAMKLSVLSPAAKKRLPFAHTNISVANQITIKSAFDKFTKDNPNILVHGGRTNALKMIVVAKKNIKNYNKTRDELASSTSQLSAYIKFGCLSIREVYKVTKSNHAFIRQLYWRDFYANILYNYPHVLGHAMKPKYNSIRWHKNVKWLNAWKTGTTGFPIVDAGMRQLNQTGYCHNRARLIVMTFLIKTLLIDWREGEKYFAQKLTDYDPASNNGNIQWVMGGGSDSNPYFRIFNPWRQTEEHDPECVYVKTWVPELKDVPVEDILNWEITHKQFKSSKYPKPICDYSVQKNKAMVIYRKAVQ